MIPRFIVQAHRNLTERPTRWRTGVVLGVAGCSVLVRGDRDKRHIDISVAGLEGLRRSALNIVLDDLEEVHARHYPEVGAKALVPLTDQPELHVSYEHLLTLEARRGLNYEFDPEGADRSYTVRELLEGVRRDTSRHVRAGDDHKRYQFRAQGNAQNTVVNGGIRGGYHQERDERVHQDINKSSWLSAFSSWRFFSIACGAGTVVIALLLLMLPSNEWRAIVAALIGLFLLVTTFVLSLNPAFFYRRLLSYLIPGGLLLSAAGFSVDAFASGEPAIGWLRWNNDVSEWFFAAWAVVVACLVWGDLKQSR